MMGESGKIKTAQRSDSAKKIRHGVPRQSTRTATTEGFYRKYTGQTRERSNSLAAPIKLLRSLSEPLNNSLSNQNTQKSTIISSERDQKKKEFSRSDNPEESMSFSKDKNEIQYSPLSQLKEAKKMIANDNNTFFNAEKNNESKINRNFFPKSTRRSFSARNLTMSDAARAAAVASASLEEPRNVNHDSSSPTAEKSLLYSMCYRGMDMLFVTTSSNKILAICARSKVTLQILDVPSAYLEYSIVSVVGNSVSGMVLATLSNGEIFIYFPRATLASPKYLHSKHLPLRGKNNLGRSDMCGFGRYQWVIARVIDCNNFFSCEKTKKTLRFVRKNSYRESDENNVFVSCCRFDKVLVAYKDNLAIFNVFYTEISIASNNDLTSGPCGSSEDGNEIINGELVWITKLHARVLHAKLSGDGGGIAVVLQDEGVGVPFPCGIRTYVRDNEDGSFLFDKRMSSVSGYADSIPLIHMSEKGSFDYEVKLVDGSSTIIPTKARKSSSTSLGVLYKPGPFLVHSRPVTRISWRGGSSAHVADDSGLCDGNDLLLSYCHEDFTFRIFSQGGMKQLIEWSSSYGSRVDWVQGISFANLGDLDKTTKDQDGVEEDILWNQDFESPSRSSSFIIGENGESKGDRFPHNPIPTTSAGAWISELTFRGNNSVLRLSRLSYVKNGAEEFQPAHFESVCAILPTGAITNNPVLEGEEESFAVQGFWPVWNTWGKGGLSGIGGSHSPPCELRIVASHISPDRVVMLEFPLWGDKEFGASEFGAPLKYVLVLNKEKTQENVATKNLNAPVALDFESSRLIAQLAADRQTVHLTWHREGSLSAHPALSNMTPNFNLSNTSLQSIASSNSIQSVSGKRSKLSLQRYVDATLIPLPLLLPSVSNLSNQGEITHIRWWPDENFGGPPRILFLNSNGTLILYEMPPPWSALEPNTPDPIENTSCDRSIASIALEDRQRNPMYLDDLDGEMDETMQEYEVCIRPHPDFGIGLRLEARTGGLPAVAGSFKKHPLTGRRLPAEKSGMITLGDELLAINDISLEGISFDEIIAEVRRIGAETNEDLWLKFRPGTERDKYGEQVDDLSMKNNFCDVKKEFLDANVVEHEEVEDDADVESYVTIKVGAMEEIQQEFCRVVAFAKNALPGENQAMILLPWNYGIDSQDTILTHGTALIISCIGRKLTASIFEVNDGSNPENSRHHIIGSVEIDSQTKNYDAIETLTVVKSATEGWCLAACDIRGNVSLIHIRVNYTGEIEDSKKEYYSKCEASFLQYHIFQCSTSLQSSYSVSRAEGKCSKKENLPFMLRAFSVQLLATMPTYEECSEVTVWIANPQSIRSSCDRMPPNYLSTVVSIDKDDKLLDFRWIPSGNLDSFPWLITFSQKSAIVHQRPGCQLEWIQVVELFYTSLKGSSFSKKKSHDKDSLHYCGVLSPVDAYPHLIPALKNMVTSSDERSHLLSDWHPESILASICTEDRGAKFVLKSQVRELFKWLVSLMSIDTSIRPNWQKRSIEVAPLYELTSGKDNERDYEEEEDENEEMQTAGALFSTFLNNKMDTKKKQGKSSIDSDDTAGQSELQDALKTYHNLLLKKRRDEAVVKPKRSKDFLLTISQGKQVDNEEDKYDVKCLPEPLKMLNEDEILFLWAIGEVLLDPPKFKKLDNSSQLTLFCLKFLRTLYSLQKEKHDENEKLLLENNFGIKKPPLHKSQTNSPFTETYKLSPPGIASCACLSALLSNTQKALLSSCRFPGKKLDWDTSRSLWLPFWLRDDEELVKVAEEIGQCLYKTTKDVMECALFYIAIRKTLKLQMMAKADNKESGRKLSKFLTTFDFATDRGRKAAEKNAYSLLRKRQYGSAAAFFLLPDPPMLSTALEVLSMQMGDISLAFMIARLVEYSTRNSFSATNGNGFALKMGNLSGFGGGGGFASPGTVNAGAGDSIYTESKFEDWNPDIQKDSLKLVKDRALTWAESDPCFRSILFLWQNQRLKAAKCLIQSSKDIIGDDIYEIDLISPHFFDIQPQESTKRSIKQRMRQIGPPQLNPIILPSTPSHIRVIYKSNNTLNFCCAPLMLKIMKADVGMKWSSALHIARAFSRRGLESSCVKTLLSFTNNSEVEEERTSQKRTKESIQVNGTSKGSIKMKSQKAVSAFETVKSPDIASSIFNSFDGSSQKRVPLTPLLTDEISSSNTALLKPTIPKSSQSVEMKSSIFDSYDAAPRKVATSKTSHSGDMASSIFDSFDAAPPKDVTPKTSHSGDMTSSIFDSFNVAPPKDVTPKTSHLGEMTSSIFDSFDAAPPKPPTPNASQSAQMTSSIFDSFNPAPPKATTQKASQSAQMASSIFDSFIPAPPKATIPKASQSNEMSSSIFDSYNPSPPKTDTPTTSQSGEMTSSIFDSYVHVPPVRVDDNDPKSLSMIHQANGSFTISSKIEKSEEKEEDMYLPLSILWIEWREHIITTAVARRLIREMAGVVSAFNGDAIVPPMKVFRKHDYPLLPAAAADILQSNCRGHVILSGVKKCLDELCDSCQIDATAVVSQALLILGCPYEPRRIVFVVLLYILMDRADLAEDVVRAAAHSQMQCCESFSLANDDLVYKRKTEFHLSSQFLRRKVARISWQLEISLWLHRGGVLPLSGIAIKEIILAVRVGLIIASWGRCFDTIESLLKCSPDCSIDLEAGRQLWMSMKIINSPSNTCNKTNSNGSGGWEFLVDCSRDEATSLLRDRKPGSFLLRPHSEDHGVFTLSFKTNLIPTIDVESKSAIKGSKEVDVEAKEKNNNARPIQKDDVVQHAIVRLSDLGFRCGSFGPFPSLLKLLKEVSSSLPFQLLFDEPPAQGIIKDDGGQPSPNSYLFRKLGLKSNTEHYNLLKQYVNEIDENVFGPISLENNEVGTEESSILNESDFKKREKKAEVDFSLRKLFGMFSELLLLSELRKQLSSIVAAEFEDKECVEPVIYQHLLRNHAENASERPSQNEIEVIDEDMFAVSSRMIRPFLCWCRGLETLIIPELAPCLAAVHRPTNFLPVDVAASETAIEATYPGKSPDGADSILRNMIQPDSDVEFSSLRVGEGDNSAIVVLFSKTQAIQWLIQKGAEKSHEEAENRLKRMENRRVIEAVDLKDLMEQHRRKTFQLSSSIHGITEDIRYRFIDPWEVEVLENKEGEGKGAALGRERLLEFNLADVARSCEEHQRILGGVRLMSVWGMTKGGIFLTKAIASMHPPWERDVGAELQIANGEVVEASPYLLSLKKRLYQNLIFRRLRLPQRFVSLIQVELLDLKNLTAPGGAPPLSAFALIRLKRTGSSSPLKMKARTLDTACTKAKRVIRISGPNAPASWGAVVRFRFSLPEDVSCDGVSYDSDREALFKGPPSVLQMSVYEKKFMSDVFLGSADVKLDALSSGSQLEEWVPLQHIKKNSGITWFARIRISLRFDLMCLYSSGNDDNGLEDGVNEGFKCPSVGLKKIQKLSHDGGAHEESKGFQKSMSTPDFLSYFESMNSF